jgi:minor curlin subunit
MKLFLSFALAGGLAATQAAQAQQRAPSEAPTAEQRLAEDISPERLPTGISYQNNALLLQNGTRNNARIDQQSLTGAGTNQAYVEQVGAANTLGLLQTGNGNVTSTTQSGNGNQADLTQQGQSNTSALTQRGDNNRLTGLVVADRTELNINQNGSNNLVNSEVRESQRSYTINQYGNNNSLKQLESTITATPGYTVEMRGSGINLTIEQGKIK